jgi:hypothetical protein
MIRHDAAHAKEIDVARGDDCRHARNAGRGIELFGRGAYRLVAARDSNDLLHYFEERTRAASKLSDYCTDQGRESSGARGTPRTARTYDGVGLS